MTDMETNMSDVEARPHSDGTRVVTSDANIQTPLPIVDVMIPTGREDQIALLQINLSISGYGPNSLRDSQLGSSDVRAQEISILLVVDGLISSPTRVYQRKNIRKCKDYGMGIFPGRHIYPRSSHNTKKGISGR